MRLIARLMLLLNEDRGQTLVEYGLVILLVAIAAIVTLGAFSGSLNAFYDTITAAIP
jgi:pilus assembly protein Flp/PilA